MTSVSFFIGATAPLFGWNAFQFTVYGSAFNISFAPVLIVLWMIMSSRDKVMGELKTKPLMNVGLVFAIAVVLSATWRFWSGVLGG
ncbi:MAG: hypothetical protein ACOCW6_04380 [Spirochaetota bacterium]